ncbi:MAG: ribosome assembly RNA-binding protein YhbY [Acidobacteria bacterium]|nr:ribosome assembly RNA-binding protein YhbY [Acidobacteriota bacterium]
MALLGSQRSYLRGLAHELRPVVQIGKEGLTEAVVESIRQALSTRELIKVQFVGSREDKRPIAELIDGQLGTECVGIIGHVAVFYREHPDPEKRAIRLPE